MTNSHPYRGLVRTCVTAGAVFSAIATGALALGLATGLVPASIFGARELVAVAVRGFVAGAAAGGIFAWFVANRERGKSLSGLSARRVALWGGLATGSIPVLMALTAAGPALPLSILAVSTLLAGIGGTVVSAGMLRVAQRAPQQLADPHSNENRLLP